MDNRKTYSFFVILILGFCMSVYGCGGANDQTAAQIEENKADMVYQGENLNLEGIKGDIFDIAAQYGRVGIITNEWLDSEYKQRIEHFYSMNADQSDFREIPLEVPENNNLDRYAFDKEGNLVYTVTNQDEDTYVGELIKVDRNGKELLRVPVQFDERVTSGLLVDGNDNVIFAQPEKISVFDKNLQCIGSLEGDKDKGEIDIALEKNGRLVCSQTYYDDEKEVLLVREIAENYEKWETSYEIPVKDTSVVNVVMDGWGEYDFCYRDNDGIYGYMTKKKSSVKLLDYIASNMTEDYTEKLLLLEDGNGIGIVYDESADTVVAMYHKVDPTVVANRKTIQVGVFGIEDDLRKAVIQYNREHSDYQIEIRDYLEADDPVQQMNTDVIAGKMPDILDISYLSVDQYIEKGLLENLTPYLEKDSEINMDDLIPAVSETMMQDHNVYFVSPSFSICSLAAGGETVKDQEGWTLEEMQNAIKEKDKEVDVFYRSDKMDSLYRLLEMEVSDFVNWSTGECYFDSEEFKELLALADQIGTDEIPEQNEEMPSNWDAIRDGKVLFWDGWVSLTEIYMNRNIFGEDVTYIGYPNKDREGSYFQFDHPLAIYSKSEEKDAAWEFIRIFMTKEYQGKKDLYGYSMPTRQDCFDLMLEANLATEWYINEMGQEIFPGEMWSVYTLSNQGVSDGKNPFTQKDADELTALIANTKRRVSYEDALMNIIQEEAEIYFAGEKSLEDTVKIINNRAETYVNENR